MSYQVIARKYRPQTFSDLTGQEHITRTIGNALEQKRLHHAYLFSGVRGTGKTTTARILAKGLNCHTGITSRPCLECPSCLEIAAGNSMDVLEIDAASNTGVDNVRDVIINNIAMAPARDRYKVFVIDEVHMLSTSAFNALLKTLEEPPAHVVFIMATTELHKVPDTILSRCQQFEFRQIATEKIFQRLREIADREQVKIHDAALREVARAGAGSLRDAQSALDQVIAFSGQDIAEEDVTTALGLVSAGTLGRFAETIAARDTPTIISLVEEIASRGYDLRNFTRELMSYFRHLLVVKSGILSGEVLGVADIEIDRLKQLASQFSEEDLVRGFHLLAETEKEVKDSPHPQFQLEIGLVKLTHATKLRTLDELIARLEELETRLSGGAGSLSAPTSTPGNIPRERAVPNNPASSKPAPGRSGMENRAAEPPPLRLPPPPKPEASRPAQAPTVNVSNEPPDFQAFDLSEPIDMPEFDNPAPRLQAAAPPRAATVTAGREIDAITSELQRMKRGLVAMALEDALATEYRDGALIVTYGAEEVLTKRLRDSSALFREIGERLFGHPIRIEVKIGGGETGGQVEQRVDEAELKRRQLRERALQNPAVKTILEKTRGELVWVKERAPAN